MMDIHTETTYTPTTSLRTSTLTKKALTHLRKPIPPPTMLMFDDPPWPSLSREPGRTLRVARDSIELPVKSESLLYRVGQ